MCVQLPSPQRQCDLTHMDRHVDVYVLMCDYVIDFIFEAIITLMSV